MTVANFTRCADARGDRNTRFAALILGLVATCSSAMVTVLAGAERGGSALEKGAWVAIGITLLLGAHFMPSLARRRQTHIRLGAGVLWLCCLLATGYTHATFYVNAQRDAGLERSHRIQLAPMPHIEDVGRTPNEIATERAKVETDLASARLAKCTNDCRWLTLRQNSLSSKLAALNIEFDEVRRREQIIDGQLAERREVLAKRDAAEADPVSIRLARLIHANDSDVSFTFAISLGLLLEVVASVSWVLACHGNSLRSDDERSEVHNRKEAELSVREMPQAVCTTQYPSKEAAVHWSDTWPTAANAPITAVAPALEFAARKNEKLTRMTVDLQVDLSVTKRAQETNLKSKVQPLSDEEMLEELVRAIRNGDTRSSLNAIKRHTGYGDARAMALRSRLVVHHPELFHEPLMASIS
ncbi:MULTISPECIES: hypothetical protein [unclassified Paraburkholderia]|uniref:hypothetical protein n=1 Tax=unclassified Paraburkholderia TaxID=2615204 RepID=UPI002AB102A7|nr:MULTISPECIES: hypothetical protein [unclassified Paraburkholderia]